MKKVMQGLLTKGAFVDRLVSAIHPHITSWNVETSGRINVCSSRRVKFADGSYIRSKPAEHESFRHADIKRVYPWLRERSGPGSSFLVGGSKRYKILSGLYAGAAPGGFLRIFLRDF